MGRQENGSNGENSTNFGQFSRKITNLDTFLTNFEKKMKILMKCPK